MKIKTTTFILLSSLAIWIVPSILISLAIFYYTNHFVIPFLIVLGVVYLIGYLSDAFFKQKTVVDIQRLNVKIKELEMQQSVEVSCSYCKERNIVPIKLNTRNTFNCQHCKQLNLMIFQFATARVTTPLDTNINVIELPKAVEKQRE